MKTISKIQLLSKIGKILSKITYICCIVGFFLCVAGIISTIIGAETITIGGVTIESILETEADVNVNTLYVMLVAGIIICIGEAVLARFSGKLFQKRIKRWHTIYPKWRKKYDETRYFNNVHSSCC